MKFKKLFTSAIGLLAMAGMANAEPAIIYDLKCAGSQAYIALAKEFLERSTIDGNK